MTKRTNFILERTQLQLDTCQKSIYSGANSIKMLRKIVCLIWSLYLQFVSVHFSRLLGRECNPALMSDSSALTHLNRHHLQSNGHEDVIAQQSKDAIVYVTVRNSPPPLLAP